MASDLQTELAALAKRLEDAFTYLQIEELRNRRPELESLAAEPGLWDDPDEARKLTTELSMVTDDIELYERLAEQHSDAVAGLELGEEFEDEVASGVTEISAALDAMELRSLFSGEYDERDAVCHVQSGEGGTDAQDWAETLVRMY